MKNRMTSMRDLRLSLTDKYSILSSYAECVNKIWICCEGSAKKTAYRPNCSLAINQEKRPVSRGRKQGVLVDANEKSLRKGDKIKEKRLSAWEKG